MKKCFKCGEMLTLEKFYKHPDMPDGRVNKCKECNKKDVRDNYAKKIDIIKLYDQKRGRHCIDRIFYQKYNAIANRCTKPHKTQGVKKSVYGTEFLTKIEWRQWCYHEKNYKAFMRLYNNWVQNNFCRKLSPSIDRKNNKIGYRIENLQWLTLSDNCKKYNK